MSSIIVDGVTKRFAQYHDDRTRIRDLFRRGGGRERTMLTALEDLSFRVEPGTSLGIIGRNGSGKTTLLRLLAGVTAPTEGRVRVEGHIAPLLGVGVGFNHELTGRENVTVNGRLLGMTQAEIKDRFDDIVDFSEIDDFIDVPVKFYSTGMFLRLAFAVAINTQPDVVLADEILAVGDVAFQAKCFGRMRDLQSAGSTIVIVTHNLTLLQSLTPRTIVLDHGRVLHDGDTEDALGIYHDVLSREEAGRRKADPVRGPMTTASSIEKVDVTMLDKQGEPTAQVRSGDPARVRITATFREPVTAPVVGFALESTGVGVLYMVASDPSTYRMEHDEHTPLVADVELGAFPLLEGTFVVRGTVIAPGRMADQVSSPRALFHVSSPAAGAGYVDVAPSMSIGGQPVSLARWSLEDSIVPNSGPTA